MKKKLAGLALLFALLLVLSTASVGAPSASDFIFTVMDQSIMCVTLPTREYVEPETLSFTQNGQYYVYCEFFASLTKINVNHNTAKQTVTVFNVDTSLFFDYSNDLAYDKQGNYYSSTALWRNGRVFLPLNVVREVFGLTVSHTPAKPDNIPTIPAPVLSISTTKSPIYDAEGYAKHFSTRLVRMYSSYLDELNTDTQQPITTEPTVPDPPKLVYLLFDGVPAAEHQSALLRMLEGEVRAAFFIPAQPQAILGAADLLRQLYAEGHAIGLMLSGGQTARAAVAEYQAANEALKSVIFTKVRLVSMGGQAVDAAVADALLGQGCRLWQPNVSPDMSQGTRALQTSLRNGLSRASGTAVVRLSPGESCLDVLPGLLEYIDSGNYSLLPITEWDAPVNAVQAPR